MNGESVTEPLITERLRLRGFQRPTDVAAFQGYRVGERMPTKERESEDHAWYIELGRVVSKEASDRQCLDLKW